MSNVSITLSQRGSIYAYLQSGLFYGQMSLRLHHSKSVIWNEVHRCKPGCYRLNKAQASERHRRSHCGRHSILNGQMASTIFNELMRHEPPELISHGLNIATSSIYHWVYGVEPSLLPEHGKRRRRKKNHRGRIKMKNMID